MTSVVPSLQFYEYFKEISSGAFGSVSLYKLKENEMESALMPIEMAVKTITVGSFQRQIREINISRQIHKNIVTCYGVEEIQPILYIKMEVAKCNLFTYQEKIIKGHLGQGDFLHLAIQMAEGLEFLHEKGISHRDIKPQNVLVFCNGDQWSFKEVKTVILKLCDFGLSRYHPGENNSVSVVGTLKYTAPEVAAAMTLMDSVIHDNYMNVDIFSLGMVFYELLFWELPFNESDLIGEEGKSIDIDRFLVKNIEDIGNLLKEMLKWSNTERIAITNVVKRLRNSIAQLWSTNEELQEKVSRLEEQNAILNLKLRHNCEQPSTTISGSSKMSRSKESDDVLKHLGLTDYYPNKITLQCVIKRSQFNLVKNEDIPWFILNGILSLDYMARNGNYVNKLFKDVEANQDSNEKAILEGAFGGIDDAEIHDTSLIHPGDAFVSTLLCCSLDLRQIVCERLFKCRLSIPLILPDPISHQTLFLSWSLRNIVCEFENLKSMEVVETPVIKQPMHFISFLRVGKLDISKSKLINDFIGKLCGPRHCTFFNHEESGGQFPRHLIDGLLEITWYFPSKKSDNVINVPLGIMNLHGSAGNTPQQAEFAAKHSNLIVILLDVKDLLNYNHDQESINKLIEISSSIALVISGDIKKEIRRISSALQALLQHFPSKVKKECTIFDSDKVGKIINIVQGITTNGAPKIMEEHFSLAAELFSVSEEHEPSCLEGKRLALNVIEQMRNENLSVIKKMQLPLQGQCWKRWVELTKQEKRPKFSSDSNGFSHDHVMAKIDLEKKNIRKEQLKVCSELPNLTNTYFRQLLSSDNTNLICYYYQKWLKLHLDAKCRQVIPKLQREYRDTWTRVQVESTQDTVDTMSLENKRQDLFSKRIQIVESSFGLEHLVRELGQMFEAITALPKDVNPKLLQQCQQLPKIIANLMLNGYPLEMMDGDASFVPVTWINAIFSQLKDIVGEKKIFVLSVLGLQSSGKSTLLNAMFGLQFAVSAGRCTRGVFAQLVPVERSDANKSFDFILVVDAEGLRAPEHGASTFQHDHELAMFVVGLGDATILNIKGENQAEMQDVLQIVVHAFLRLHRANNNIKLQPACLLVHHNVSAVNANQKMTHEQQRIQDDLDKITIAAAEQEGIDNIKAFRDVIEFDPTKHVWCFSDLWQGDPPMAPANPGYSKDITDVKEYILNQLMSNVKKGQTISGFENRLNDLWQGILQEDFVFSFRNSIEIRAFTNLEQFQGSVNWEAKSETLRLIEVAKNKIFGWNTQQLNTEYNKLKSRIMDELKSHFSKSEITMETFFQNSLDEIILEQWKQRTIINFHNLLGDELAHLERECNNFHKERKFRLEIGQTTALYKDTLVENAKMLANDFRGKSTDEAELKQDFREFWTTFEKSNSDQINVKESIDIECLVWNALENVYLSRDRRTLNQAKENLQNKYTYRYLLTEYDMINEHELLFVLQELVDWHYFSMPSHSYWKINIDLNYCQNMLHQILKKEIDEMSRALREVKNEKPTDITPKKILSSLYESLHKLDKDTRFSLSPVLAARIMIVVSKYIVEKLSKNYESYLREHDPLIYLREKHYNPLESFFIGLVKQRSAEQTSANILCDYLKKKIQEAGATSRSRLMANEIRSCHAWCQSKEQLIIKILSDSSQNEEHTEIFEEIRGFVTNFNKSIARNIKKYVNVYLFGNNSSLISTRYVELTSRHLKDLMRFINDSFSRALATKGRIWLEEFRERVSGSLSFDVHDMQLVSEPDINDVSFFENCVKEGLTLIEQEIGVELESHGPSDIQEVYEMLFKEVAGCTEQCPFCGSPCSLTTPDHSGFQHSCVQHYPQGVKSWQWEQTKKLVIENCTTHACSDIFFNCAKTNYKFHPFREYEKIFPDWIIPRDASMSSSLFWKWYLANFAEDIVRIKKLEMPDIPEEWKNITKEEAIASLSKD